MFFKKSNQLKQEKSEEKKELINNLLAIFFTIIVIFVFYFIDYYFYGPQKPIKTPVIKPAPSSNSQFFNPGVGSPFGKGNIHVVYKPVIYLYPEHKTDVKVTLDYDGDIIADYPVYDKKEKGWEVTAYPDSTIINKVDNKEYSYLFWEGLPQSEINWNLNTGFVVKGSETREFLQEILPKMGLTSKEYNEFIVYWYPIMQGNAYNLIHFAGKQYTNSAQLDTEPKSDSMLRVFMVVKPLDKPINIQPQFFEKFERKGFTVVEWGGTVLK